MNAQQIIEYIRTSEKKTPVKVYVWEEAPVAFPGCHEFPAGEGCKIVFGDWKDVKPVLEANEFAHFEIESNCRNSAIPMLDLKDIPAIYDMLRKGCEKARQAAIETMDEVRKAMKITYFDDEELIKEQAKRYAQGK